MSRPLRLASVLPLSLLLVGLASCSGRGGGSTLASEGPVPLIHLYHPNTPIVTSTDMDGLRRSPYYDTLRDMVALLPERERADLEQAFLMLDRTDHVLVGADPFGPGADETLVALRGAFEPRHLDAITDLDQTEMHRTHTLRGTGSEWAVVPDSGTLLIGRTQELHDALDRLDGIYPGTGPTRPGFAEAATLAQLGQRDMSAVWVFTDEMRAGLGSDHVEHALHENGVSAGMWLHLRDGAHFQGFVVTNDAAAVPVLAHALQEALGELSGEPAVEALGLTTILEQVQINEEGTTLRVELRATDDQVRGLISNFQQFLQSTPRN